jgi:Uncharacterized protein conserved in archaea
MIRNRRLLISVFSPQEAREALIGGARIIDCEDPRTSLGNISPRQIMRIAASVLSYKTDAQIQISTNIGEDQLLFRRGANGVAMQKFVNEIAGKAAQAALGVAASMGAVVHPVNIVKIGLDAMELELIKEVLEEIVFTIHRSDSYHHAQIVPVFFIRDVEAWNRRRGSAEVIKRLLDLREFYFDDNGDIDLSDYYTDAQIARLLPHGAQTTFVSLNQMYPYSNFGFANDTKHMLTQLIDLCAQVGVDGLMLDTPIQHKVIRVGMLKHPRNAQDRGADGKMPPREGLLTLDEARFFCQYCHWAGIEAYLAGSIQAYQAEELWEIEELDSIAVREAASAVVRDPTSMQLGNDTRHERRIRRELVAKLIPPEQEP